MVLLSVKCYLENFSFHWNPVFEQSVSYPKAENQFIFINSDPFFCRRRYCPQHLVMSQRSESSIKLHINVKYYSFSSGNKFNVGSHLYCSIRILILLWKTLKTSCFILNLVLSGLLAVQYRANSSTRFLNPLVEGLCATLVLRPICS